MPAYEKITQPVKADLDKVERRLKKVLSEDLPFISPAAKFLLNGGGKRLRPAMLLLCAKVCGAKPTPKLIDYAASVELIHMGTLVFDDLLDGSSLRRGRKTVNVRWGERVSVLLGLQFYLRVINLLKTEDQKIRALMVDTANTIFRGEVGQIGNRGNLSIDEKEYLKIISKKSAVFISACCKMGAMTNGTPNGHLRVLEKYGMNVGIAFQIQDDVLDYIADEKKLGKKVGSDLLERRVTLPVIHCLGLASRKDRQAIQKVFHEKQKGRRKETPNFRELRSILERNGSFSYCWDRARQFGKKAMQDIKKLSPSEARKSLEELCDFVIERTY